MRREIKGRLTIPAWQAWDRMVTDEGVTTAGLLEALAMELAEGRWHPTERAVARAKKIDKERGSRR